LKNPTVSSNQSKEIPLTLAPTEIIFREVPRRKKGEVVKEGAKGFFNVFSSSFSSGQISLFFVARFLQKKAKIPAAHPQWRQQGWRWSRQRHRSSRQWLRREEERFDFRRVVCDFVCVLNLPVQAVPPRVEDQVPLAEQSLVGEPE